MMIPHQSVEMALLEVGEVCDDGNTRTEVACAMALNLVHLVMRPAAQLSL